ncbi:MAG: O-antigen ligase family protein [Balneolales bacterium]
MIQQNGQPLLLVAAVLIYLIAFAMVWFLGFIYALPFLWVLPLIGYYLLQSVIKPILLLIPMLGATYLGDVVRVIPDGTIPLTLFQIFLFLGIAVFFLHYLLKNEEKFRILGIELELLLIFTLMSFSIFYSPNRESALLNLSRMFFLIIMVYLIINILRERKHFFTVFTVLTAIATLLGVLSVQAALLDPVTAIMNIRAGGTRIFGRGAITVHDPNVFATLFFLPIAFTTSIFFSRMSYHWRAPAFVVTLILLAGLASTYSRSAWIATAFLLLMLVVYYRQYKMVSLVLITVLVVFISIPELRNMSVGFFNRILDIFSGATDDSSRIRLLLGIAAIHMFFDSWMMGVGFRGFPETFTNYFNTRESIGVVEPHNVIYELLAELGIIGFGLFLFLAIIIFKKASHNVHYSQTELDKVIATTLISSLIAFFIFFQFYGGALVNTNLWGLIGLIFAQGYYVSYKNTRSKILAFDQ